MAFLSNREDFERSLLDFHERRGTPMLKIPIMSRTTLDLFRLFTIVRNCGGFEQVDYNRKWRIVNSEMRIPLNGSSAYILRRHYERLLYPFERVKVFLFADDLSLGLEQGTQEDTSVDVSPNSVTTFNTDVSRILYSPGIRNRKPKGLGFIFCFPIPMIRFFSWFFSRNSLYHNAPLI